MRTTLDLPDALFRQLKAQAALQGITLKSLLQRLIERGLKSAAGTAAPGVLDLDLPGLPVVSIGRPMGLAKPSNAALFDLLKA